MLFEVVEARPQFAGFGTSWSEASIHARLADVFAVNGLFMAIEVIDGREADLTSRTAFFDTSIRSRVSGVVFSVMRLAIRIRIRGPEDSLEIGVLSEGETTLIANESLVLIVSATGC